MREKNTPDNENRVTRRSGIKLGAGRPAAEEASAAQDKKQRSAAPSADEVPSRERKKNKEKKKAPNGADKKSRKGEKPDPAEESPSSEKAPKKTVTPPPEDTPLATEKDKKNRVLHQVTPYIFFWIALFALVSFILDLYGKESAVGTFGSWFSSFLSGLFGPCAYLFPFLLIILALRWHNYVKRDVLTRKILLSSSFYLLLTGVVHVFLDSDTARTVIAPGVLYAGGMAMSGSGLFGGFIGEWLGFFLRTAGTCLLCLPLLILIAIYLVDLTPSDLWQRIRCKIRLIKEKKAQRPAKEKMPPEQKQQKTSPAATMPTPAGLSAACAHKQDTQHEVHPAPEAVSWRAPRPLDEHGRPTYTFREEEPDVEAEPTPAKKAPERVEKKQTSAARRREAASALYENMQEADAVRTSADQQEARIVFEAKPASPAQPGHAADPTFTIHSYRDQKPPVKETEELPRENDNYYAPFALPVRPEPKRAPKESASRIVITPHAPTALKEEQANTVHFAEEEADPNVLDATDEVLAVEEETLGNPFASDAYEDESFISVAEDPVIIAPVFDDPIEPTPAPAPVPQPATEPAPRRIAMAPKPTVITAIPEELTPEPAPEPRVYQLPPITLLNEDKGSHANYYAEMQDKKERLRQTLADFGLRIQENIECYHGPSITRYEFAPEAGVSVRSIQNRIDDISLSMGAHVRIEGLVMGKRSIGVEVPNSVRETVYMRTVLESEAFSSSAKPLEVPLGLDIGGSVQMCNLAAMPHLLIAGSTGSGKSVCINVMLISLLYKTSPEDLRLILIDPKQVEFAPYEHVPHLYMPIITDMQRAAGALSCAVQEMERRFSLFKDIGVRDLDGYNDMVKNDPEREHLPRIIIVIDEFADLKMSCANNDPELFTCRIAQKARAAGIHLIIGTQRPSVDVITGKLKTNIASRIAFMVKQQVDSRTILDINGAETLTGKGDMLYMPSGSVTPTRVQGPFVSDGEVSRVVSYIRDHNDPVQYNQAFMDQIEVEMAKANKSDKKSDDFDYGDADENEDPKFAEAVALAVETQKVATSLLQRRLGVGYGRAAKIIDRMEELGLVSAPDGNKARKILPAAEGYLNHLGLGEEDYGEEYDQ